MRNLSLFLALFFVTLVAACSHPAAVPKSEPAQRAHVVAWKPGDALERTDEALSVVFDRPMVGAEDVGPVLATPPVSVAPSRPLRVHWEDEKTLHVEAETEWKAGQHYTLNLEGPLAAELSGPRQFAFDVQPLVVRWSTLPSENAARDREFDLVFNLDVKTADAAARCALVSAAKKRVALREKPFPNDETRDPHRVRLEPAERLELSTHYELDCTGLLPAGGDAAWRREPNAKGFTTHGLLALQHGWPATGSALPPEKAELCLELSTPVDQEELKRHVHLSPAPEGLENGWYEGRCGDAWVSTHRANSTLLAPRRRFAVTVDAELKDVFGQTLGKIERWEFTTGDRMPGLWTATGVGAVLEAGRKEHALGTLNLERAELSCTSLSPAQLAANLAAFSSWVNESLDTEASERAEAPWLALKLAPRVHALDAKAAANKARTIALDLGAQCGASSGRAGLYALELVPHGARLAELGRQGDNPARLLANVTDLGVVVKRGLSTALVWVSQLSNGALVADAAVELYDASGRVLKSARTDATGLARFSNLPARSDGELFAVKKGDDAAIVGSEWLWREGLDSWQLGVREGDDENVRLFVHTDRGIYRPGERVLVHGLARTVSDSAPARVPAQRGVSLALKDGDDTVYARSLELSEFGSFSAVIELPPHLAPGSHPLEVSVAGKSDTLPISVAEFRPLTFELSGGPAREEVFAGERVKVELGANYLFGAVLAGADLHFTVERAPAAVSAAGLEEFSFQDYAPSLPNEEPWPEAAEGVLLEEDGKTDAKGHAQFEFETEASRRPTRYTITAAASDAGKDRATRSMSVLAHSADRYVGARMTRFVFAPGESIQSEIVIVDRKGKPIAGDAELELRHEEWDCKDPLQSCRARVLVLEKQSVHVTADKPALATFSAQAHGSVHVRAVTRDAAGRLARASDSAWLWSSEGEGPYNDRVAATLSTDRRAYRVGDRARLALQTPLAPDNLLVTAERGDVLSATVVARAAGLPLVDLGKNTAPNAFLTVTGMTPRKARGEQGKPRLTSGAKEVAVRGPSRVLTTTIKLANDHYEPHQRVEGDVEVKHLGKPVAAEIALVAVNESVLQLTGFETPDPTKVFHAPRGLSVRTLSNITRVIGDPQKAAAVPETARLGTPGEDGGGGRPDLRDDYVAAAYFAPDLRTDDKGRVHFAFDAPTDLSAYRLMAVAAAKDDRVGSSAQRFTVSQPISAHLLAPRFASRGDTIEVGALVHDTTGAPGPTEVRYAASGFTLSDKSASVTATPTGAAVRTRAVVQNVDSAWFEVEVGSSRVDLQACKLEYSIVSPK